MGVSARSPEKEAAGSGRRERSLNLAVRGVVLDRFKHPKERLGRQILFRVRHPGDRRGDEWGRCSVCGRAGRFILNNWILPAELKRDLGSRRLVEAFAARESLFCRSCGASQRARRLVDVLLDHYAENAATLAELVEEHSFRRLQIAEINSLQLIHPYLEGHPGLRYSEYRPNEPLGVEVEGVRNEDVCRLSYSDEEFDLVLTSDTLEHVPDPYAAIRETRRVLKYGGRHIFTVPLVPSRQKTITRAAQGADGRPVHLLPPQFHGRGSGLLSLVSRRDDLLTYTDFGLDVTDHLRQSGFEPEVHFYNPSDPDADAALVLCATARFVD